MPVLSMLKVQKQEFMARLRQRLGIWEAMEYLNALVDDSDQDTVLTPIEHLMQAAQAIWFMQRR